MLELNSINKTIVELEIKGFDLAAEPLSCDENLL